MVFLFQYTWWESYNWFQYKLLLSLTETGHYYFRFYHHFNCLQIVRIVTLMRSQGLVTSRSIALSYKLSNLFCGEATFSQFQVVFENFRTKYYRLCTADSGSFPQQGEIITILCGPQIFEMGEFEPPALNSLLCVTTNSNQYRQGWS